MEIVSIPIYSSNWQWNHDSAGNCFKYYYTDNNYSAITVEFIFGIHKKANENVKYLSVII